MKGRIHSIESMGLMDGPGVRMVFFLQGCPLRCLYCHNPDSQAFDAKAEELTPQQVLDMALRQKPYFGEDGGVTFSGGEPLMQGAFVLECLQLLKANGINTAVDTSGFGDSRYYKFIFPLIDTILLDVKAFESGKFKALTEGSFETYLKFVEALNSSDFHGQIWVRHVMLPGHTDNEKAMEELVSIITPLSYKIDRIEILPYHTMGVEKYKQMGLEYKLKDMPPMDKDRAKELERYAHRHYLKELTKIRKTRRISGLNSPSNISNLKKVFEMKKTSKVDVPQQDDSLYIHEGVDIRQLPLLRHISVDDFYEVAKDIQIKHVKKGELIFKSGDPASVLYIVCDGRFKIYTNTPDGREQIMYIYGPGDFVGGLNLLKNHKYIYMGQATEDGTICLLSKKIFDSKFVNNPKVLKQILEKSYDRIRWAEELISRLSNTNAGIKVAELLLRFSQRYGKETPEGIRVDLKLTREELGSYAGLTRETFTRKLSEFKDLGYLDYKNNNYIIIKNEEALRDYVMNV